MIANHLASGHPAIYSMKETAVYLCKTMPKYIKVHGISTSEKVRVMSDANKLLRQQENPVFGNKKILLKGLDSSVVCSCAALVGRKELHRVVSGSGEGSQ